MSDTFDRKNNNWGFRVCPMGLGYGHELKDRMVVIVLWLYKPCHAVNGFEFECVITNSCNDE